MQFLAIECERIRQKLIFLRHGQSRGLGSSWCRALWANKWFIKSSIARVKSF